MHGLMKQFEKSCAYFSTSNYCNILFKIYKSNFVQVFVPSLTILNLFFLQRRASTTLWHWTGIVWKSNGIYLVPEYAAYLSWSNIRWTGLKWSENCNCFGRRPYRFVSQRTCKINCSAGETDRFFDLYLVRSTRFFQKKRKGVYGGGCMGVGSWISIYTQCRCMHGLFLSPCLRRIISRT